MANRWKVTYWHVPAAMALAAFVVFAPRTGYGLQATGYTSAKNNRFSSGYPAMPVENTNAAFVGLDYDWTGVGWGATNTNKQFGFISPQHYLVARHFGGDSQIRLLDGDGGVVQMAQWKVEQTGTGAFLNGNYDLSIGTLQDSIAAEAGIARYAVLDLNPSSTNNTLSEYVGIDAFLYGRGVSGQSPRIGETAFYGGLINQPEAYFTTTRVDVQLQGGDSGSPAFAKWINPNGDPELAILGNNAAISSASDPDQRNFMNFTGTSFVIDALNTRMVDDGRALRVVGDPQSVWQQTAIFADTYTLFDAGITSIVNLTVDSAVPLRGLYFKATAATNDAFGFSGSGSLDLGRGGITNYDNDRQIFSVNLNLTDHQFWHGGPGGITAANVATGGNLVEIQSGAEAVRITGVISGSGSVALDQGRLELSGQSTFTGSTWVHSGTLRVNGDISSSSSVRLGSDGILEGSGSVSLVTGSGMIAPGNSAGILTAFQVDPSESLSFHFEFGSLGSPDYAVATSSGNDVLRLTSATPFTGALSSTNLVAIYFAGLTIAGGDIFRGGFFSDLSASLENSILGGTFAYFVETPGGSILHGGNEYDVYTGPLIFEITAVAETANFASGSVNGMVMQLLVVDPTPVPEPGAWTAGVILLLVAMAVRRRRGRCATR